MTSASNQAMQRAAVPRMAQLQRSLIVVSILLTCSSFVCGQETEERTKEALEAPSPDGQFAFRYTPVATPEAQAKSDEDTGLKKQTYDLIEKRTGKVLMSVAESDPDIGPSARFVMKVRWRPDSKAFALTAYLQKRGSEVSVYMRDGATFRAIELPGLEVDIPEKLDRGKTTNMNSQSARRWLKDGSLMIEIETTSSGNEGTVTATRTVVLGFGRSDKATIRKSTVKVTVDKE